MKIRNKLLIIFLPLIIIPISIMGYLAVNSCQSLLVKVARISANEESLQVETNKSIKSITEITEDKLTNDYEYVSQHLLDYLELSYAYLIKAFENFAQCILLESYMSAPESGREIIVGQLITKFNNIIKNYYLSEISILEPGGIELIRSAVEIVPVGEDPYIDGEQIPNRSRDESKSEWFKNLKMKKNFFISNVVYFKKDFDVERPEPVLSLLCPLRYKDNHYSPKYGQTLGYLKFSIPLCELCKFIVSGKSGSQNQVFVTDSKGKIVAHTEPDQIGTFFDVNSTEFENYSIFSQHFLNGLLNINVLVSKEEIQKISAIVKSFFISLKDHISQVGDLSIEIKQNITRLKKVGFIMTCIALIIATTIVVLATHKISSRISNLSKTAKLIAKGNLNVKPVPFYCSEDCLDEICTLSQNLNQMRLNLKEQIESLDKRVAEKTNQLQTSNKQLIEEIAERKRIEEALRESEERFRYITEFSPFPIAIIDAAGRYLYINKKFRHVFGYSLKNIPANEEWLTAVLEESDSQLQCVSAPNITNLKNCPVGSPLLFKARCKNITVRDVICRSMAIDKEKQFIIYEDITEYKRAEEELKASEEKYRELINNSLDGIVSVDSAMRIISWNPAAEKIFGYFKEKILGRSLATIVPQRYRQTIEKGFGTFKKSGSGAVIGKTMELRALREDGSEIPIEMSVSARKVNGTYITIAIIRDIFDRKRAEAELRIKESAIASSINAISITDLEGNLTYVNNSFLKLWGYRDENEVLGKPAEKFWSKNKKNNHVFKTIDEKKAWTREITAKTKNGSLLNVQISENIVTDETGEPVCRMASFVDLTERKYLEKEILEISEKEQQRIGRDLHDGLGQDLTGTAFISKVLEQKLLGKAMPEASEAAEIAKLINQSIAKIHNVVSILNPIEQKAEGLMIALKKLASNVSKIFNVFCRLECKKPILIHNNTINTHLYRIAQEAVNNAVKHGKSKHITISLNGGNKKIIMTIKNDGLDFPKELVNSRGMGLNIMKYRAGMINGSLEIRRNPGSGTIVTCLCANHMANQYKR